MKSTSFYTILLCAIILLIFSGCTTFTKMRYSNGYKLDMEMGRNNSELCRTITARAAIKRQNTLQKLYLKNPSSFKIPDQPARIMVQKEVEKSIHANTQMEPSLKTESIHPLTLADSRPADADIPLAPGLKVAKWLFFSGFGLSVVHPAFLLLAIAGLVIALLGLRRIRRSGPVYRGKGLAYTIIAFSILMIPVFIFAPELAAIIAALILAALVLHLFVQLFLAGFWHS